MYLDSGVGHVGEYVIEVVLYCPYMCITGIRNVVDVYVDRS